MLTGSTAALTALLAGSSLTWSGEPAGGTARSVQSLCADGTSHTRFEGTSPDGVHHVGFSDQRWEVVAAGSRRAGTLRVTDLDGGEARRVRIRVRPRAGTAVLDGRRQHFDPAGGACGA